MTLYVHVLGGFTSWTAPELAHRAELQTRNNCPSNSTWSYPKGVLGGVARGLVKLWRESRRAGGGAHHWQRNHDDGGCRA